MLRLALLVVLLSAVQSVTDDKCPFPRRADYPTHPDFQHRLRYMGHHINDTDPGNVFTVFIYKVKAPCEEPFAGGCAGCRGACSLSQQLCDHQKFCRWEKSSNTCARQCMNEINDWVIGTCSDDFYGNILTDPPAAGIGYSPCGLFGLGWSYQRIAGNGERFVSALLQGAFTTKLGQYAVADRDHCYVGPLLIPTRVKPPTPTPPPEPTDDCPDEETVPRVPVEDVGITVDFTPPPVDEGLLSSAINYTISSPDTFADTITSFTINTCDGDPSNIWATPPIQRSYSTNACGLTGLTWEYRQLTGSVMYYHGFYNRRFKFVERNYTLQTESGTCYWGTTQVPVAMEDNDCTDLRCQERSDLDSALACCNELRENGCLWRDQNACVRAVVATRDTFFRFIHGSWNIGLVDIYVNSELVLERIVFSTVTGYRSIVPAQDGAGARSISIRITRTGDPGFIYAETTIDAETRTRRTIAFQCANATADPPDCSIESATDDASSRPRVDGKRVPWLRLLNVASIPCITVVDAATQVVIAGLERIDNRRITTYVRIEVGYRRLAIRRCAEPPLKVQTQGIAAVEAEPDLTLVDLDVGDESAYTVTFEGDEEANIQYGANVAADYYSEEAPAPDPAPPGPGGDNDDKPYNKYWFWLIMGISLVAAVGLVVSALFVWNRRRAGFTSIKDEEN